jgi:DNA-binding transcriptional regulator/RsmH inhibitor MraZ
MGDYFEIWSEELWQKQEERNNDDQTNEDRFKAIDLTLR